MKNHRTLTLVLAILLGLLLGSMLQIALASRAAPDYGMDETQAAPLSARAAPYGQYLVSHSSASITTTLDMGTVMRTSGYDPHKTIICSTGNYAITGTLYARVTSTGDPITITANIITLDANESTIISFTETAPWMSLGLVAGEVTGTTTTCGIWVQTP